MVSFTQWIDCIQKSPPNIIFLTGKSCNGKSHISNILRRNMNYIILELDVIIRNLAKKYNIGLAPDYDTAFSIYKDTLHNDKFRNEFISIIRDRIDNNIMIVIEGAISSTQLIDDIFDNLQYMFVFLRPTSISRYGERIMKRIKYDIDNNKRSLVLWNDIKPEINELLIKKEFSNINIENFVKEHAKEMLESSEIRFKSFSDYDTHTIEV